MAKSMGRKVIDKIMGTSTDDEPTISNAQKTIRTRTKSIDKELDKAMGKTRPAGDDEGWTFNQ